MGVADSIKHILRNEDVKHKKIATKLGLSQQQFSDMLNGRKAVYADDIPDICEAIGITPGELYANDLFASDTASEDV